MEYPIPKSLVLDTTNCPSSSVSNCIDLPSKLSKLDLALIKQMYPKEPKTFSYNIQCITSGTSWKGESQSCDTGYQCSSAPDGYAFVFPTVNRISMNGKSSDCAIQGYSPVGNLGGNTDAYQQICYRAWASSRSGMSNSGVRGWANCQITGSLRQINPNPIMCTRSIPPTCYYVLE